MNRKEELLARAEDYRRMNVYLPDEDEYVTGIRVRPDLLAPYQGNELEPVVSTLGLYDLADEAHCTVNGYNAVVLNSKNLLIADVDFGDRRLSQWAGPTDIHPVLEALAQLHLLDGESGTAFAKEQFRVYRTFAGCRVVCTSRPFAWAVDGWQAERLMRFLDADPKYAALCGEQKCYRARLTPKPWRVEDRVCDLWSGAEAHIHPDLAEQVRLHDDFTLAA